MLTVLLACASPELDDAVVAEPYAELKAQGIDRYLGATSPSHEATGSNGDVSYTFDEPDGPACMYGEPFRTMVRDRGSEDLVFFLQGGGLCYSELCLAVSGAPVGIPNIDVLRDDLPSNPVADWNVTYVPYCDGSLFGGDAAIDDDGDGEVDRLHRGLMNLSAALDVASDNFPTPRRILLAGSSGGGYGTIPAAVLARLTWPDAAIYVFNDAGVGLGRDQDPDFIWGIIDEFQANTIVPDSQVGLLDDGHLTPLIGWQLDQDPGLRVSAFSSRGDYVISQIYLQVPPDDFEDSLEGQLGAVHEAHPGRFQSFLIDGSVHTTLLGDPSGFLSGDEATMALVEGLLGGIDESVVDGVSIAAWLAAMVDEDDSWGSLAE